MTEPRRCSGSQSSSRVRLPSRSNRSLRRCECDGDEPKASVEPRLALCCSVAIAFLATMTSLPAYLLPLERSAIARSRPLVDTEREIVHPLVQLEDETAGFSTNDLPPGETYVALQRIQYLPGAQLAEPPSDGPKLLHVLSGNLTIRVPISGVTVSGPSAEGILTSAIDPGVDQLTGPEAVVMIPAGIPAQLRNRSAQPVEWVQFQIETPATLCSCGEDRSGVEMELLSSRTLPEPLSPPAVVSLTRQRLEPASEVPAPSPGMIQIVGTLGDDVTLLRRDDGSMRNHGSEVIDVFVATIATSAAS